VRVALGKRWRLIEVAGAAQQLEALFPWCASNPPASARLTSGRGISPRFLGAAAFPAKRGPRFRRIPAQPSSTEKTLPSSASSRRLVAPRMSFAQALCALLRRLCTDTLFQPETPDRADPGARRVESAGLEFDAIVGERADRRAWPLARRPSFIPPALRRKAGIPEASAEATLARASASRAGGRGGEVVVPSAMEEDRVLLASH